MRQQVRQCVDGEWIVGGVEFRTEVEAQMWADGQVMCANSAFGAPSMAKVSEWYRARFGRRLIDVSDLYLRDGAGGLQRAKRASWLLRFDYVLQDEVEPCECEECCAEDAEHCGCDWNGWDRLTHRRALAACFEHTDTQAPDYQATIVRLRKEETDDGYIPQSN